ncbi:NAD(P)-binding domain-containing protein [Paenibacillus sp. sptzw28]|uniref:NADPH-dependent F420 reductase n=1 Tax=Paenibacillus sp. sptzw28 TaxID=715179 RepID=UPI001C6DD7D0|nr:NAD(P)-binding domain-containing protein [Paenibacillus sp. sptzw28]QYR22713.1 NAD(P)-binding domain-containing protein [Paenibacillus sp. sptzw28]
MKIGFIGSGNAAQMLGRSLAKAGHDVKLGARNPDKLNAWLEQQQQDEKVSVGTVQEAAVHGDIVFNATPGTASLEALSEVGSRALQGKVLVDIALPLDFSNGELTLAVANTDSLGEQIQRAFPDTKVVKTLNTVSSAIMVNPQSVADGQHDLFVSGNDADAKRIVTALLKESFGWESVIDLGDISSARGTEMLLALSSRIYQGRGHMNFNVKIVG